MGRGLQPRPSSYSLAGRTCMRPVHVPGFAGRRGLCCVRFRLCSGHRCRRGAGTPWPAIPGGHLANALPICARASWPSAFCPASFCANTHSTDANRAEPHGCNAHCPHATASQPPDGSGHNGPGHGCTRPGAPPAAFHSTGRACSRYARATSVPNPRSPKKARPPG